MRQSRISPVEKWLDRFPPILKICTWLGLLAIALVTMTIAYHAEKLDEDVRVTTRVGVWLLLGAFLVSITVLLHDLARPARRKRYFRKPSG